jgi:type VI secretion system protein ImpH
MASEDRATARDLAWLRAVAEKPFRYSLFGLLRRLEHERRDEPRFGESVRPAEDPIRLGQAPSMAFAPAELSALVPGANGRPPRLEIHGFGLLGPNGPLPLHLTQHVRDRRYNMGDPTLGRFLDLFHHRMISLFYRAWANAEPTVEFERGNEDRFATYVGSVFGIGFASLRHRDALPDAAKLHYAGCLAVQNRAPGPLREMLQDYFGVPVDLEEFVGEWLEIPGEPRRGRRDEGGRGGLLWELGASPATGTLGVSATVGKHVWSRSHRFRVVVGPLGWEDFRRFLIGGESLSRLVALVRNYVGDELVWDLNLILRRDEVPPLRLGEEGQLGLTAWLPTDYRDTDAADVLIDPLVARSASERSARTVVVPSLEVANG